MHILIINGPSINLLGEREPELYGHKTYAELEETLKTYAQTHQFKLTIHQTNYEGMIIDLLQLAHKENYTAVILNAGAFTHYSYALYDAIKAIKVPVYEVHLTNPKEREEPFRHRSLIEPACKKSFVGKGFESYLEAIATIIGRKP